MPGIGCMRLSTEHDRDDEQSTAVIRAALDAGVTLFDTADAYCWDDSETGHNERLIARSLAGWSGDRSTVCVATKGGLTRPGGQWIPDGRARHLAAACEASCRALGVNTIDLYQLHATDPRVNLATSVRALAALKRNGLIRRVGLCNVTVGQLDQSQRIVDIDAVQVELNALHDGNFLSGIVEHCIRRGIRVIASRPLGGAGRLRRTASDPTLNAVAARHAATPVEIALAWLADLSPFVVTIPGVTRMETVASTMNAAAIALTEEDRSQLDQRFSAAARVRRAGALRRTPEALPHTPEATPDTTGEIVMIMGLPGAGKSTFARSLVGDGYVRLNRDEGGGLLKDLLRDLRRAIDGGASRIVMDNTYVTRKSRAAVVHAMASTGLPVRCVWLSTSIEDAQVNAAWRMVGAYGRLLDPEEMRAAVKKDVSAFGPGVQFRYLRELEPPEMAEGFSRIDRVAFTRTADPAFTNRALVVWCDGVLTDHPERDDVLRRYASEGWRLLGLGWRQGPADEIYDRLRERVGVPIDILYCPHGGGPPVCWCRKPLPGLGVVFIRKYELDPAACVYVGGGPQDPGYARRLGFQYRNDADFFAC